MAACPFLGDEHASGPTETKEVFSITAITLDGKVAIVTGAASGIGKATAEALAAAGACVAVCDRDRERGEWVAEHIARSGGDALYVEADLADPASPARLVEAATGRWGRLDIVVNSAGIVCNKPVERIAHEDWDRLFAVNLKAPFFIGQAALPWLKASKGTIIQIGSVNGWNNAADNLVYDTMKAALNHMTKGLALDLRTSGVRFNAVLPGGTATPLLDQWFKQSIGDSEEAERVTEEVKREPHVASPQQIADAVLLLACGQASWINGALIPVDGGYHLG